MSYRTILSVLRSPEDAARLVPSAAALCRRFDAHMDLLCVGIDEVQMGYYFAGADAVVQQLTLDQAQKRAEETVTAAEALAGVEDVRWSVRGLVAQFGAAGDVVAQAARYADLVVLGSPYGEDTAPADETILEAALFAAECPVLVVPRDGLGPDFAQRVVIGWNDGPEALRAVRGALPLLSEADSCSIAIVDPPPRGRDQSEPGRSLSVMLDRHGVKAEVALLPKSHPRIADVLREHAADREAGLLVIGAYGHSRLREAIMGGATRDLLREVALPVLLAH